MKKTNALVAKEIRLLLPAYVAALVLAILPVWLLPNVPYRNSTTGSALLVFCAFGFGIVMLALSSFGREFGMKTFPLMLAQPLPRHRVWWTKTGILACAIASIYYAWISSWNARDVGVENYASSSATWFEMLVAGGLATVTIFAGGLFATLLVRQVAAAFWFAVFVPLAIEVFLQAVPGWLNCAILVAYAIAVFLAGWWLFNRAQEVGWTGGTIAFPGWRSDDIARPHNRSRRPLAALFWKELQLHQVGLAGMGGLFILHLGVVLWRKHGGDSLNDTLKTGLDVFGGLWFLVPLLIGGTSVAEERKLGTMQSHLTLPVSRKIQFTIKLLTVLFIGGLLSAVLLWTVEGIASALGAYCGVEILKTPFAAEALFALCWLFLACSLVSFFASTLVGGLIQSFAASVLTGAGFWLLLLLVGWVETVVEQRFGFILASGHLLLLILLPAAVVTLVILSYRNFKTVSESWQLWRRNLLTFICVLLGACVLTASIYNRVWELVTPLEPAHGPARIVGTRPPVIKYFDTDSLNLLMPDGRIWANRLDFDEGTNWFGFPVGQKWNAQHGDHFLSGSNWIDALTTYRDTVAIRDDGTLWVSERPSRTWHLENKKRVYQRLEPAPLIQYGTETNWQSVVPDGWGATVVLLKQDGTLWHWSPTDAENKEEVQKDRPWPGLRAFKPQRMGTGTNWNRIIGTSIIGTGVGVYAWKDDGQFWTIYQISRTARPSEIELEPGMVMCRYTNLDGFKFKSLTAGRVFEAGLGEDGTLWTWVGHAQRPLRLGKDDDWTSLAGDYGRFVARKADGSLWQWNFNYHNPAFRYFEFLASKALPDLAKIAPTRVGSHDDWLAVAENYWPDGVIGLAADGSLWQWWDRDDPYYGYGYFAQNLSPPRKPAYIANIFDNSK